jgi:DNA-binding transcriptional regulator LsrR (DeoR family)
MSVSNSFHIGVMTLRSAQEAAQILVAAGHSQAAIAQRVNVKQPTISRILSGAHKDTRGAVLVELNVFADEVAAATTGN